MALWDALIRILVGSILVLLGVEKGGIFVIATFVGVVLILTAITGFCLIYKIAGISSKGEPTQA
ncbi:MAG TPA: DUF2892 domain-containing protein [Sulfurihydrogenibium sp.]|uniref:YgaP family membrane protein n=1 Tax=Sulfurihydrogenibium sp. (strain YO3AOP1) TaxID=436114 RepID=UPI0001725EAB|nr:DUF2892 domain-containing protein [Sulfurihydrogenibium sp. YO3AOP1]ACD66116.1 hypothetical protein SYO3AOP1_0475 [Sulfurihydrogenibium sp. YO3AOP1]HBT98422.1 DUF2892 domain-containing protein [Sulfurihydrogenibium sp.]